MRPMLHPISDLLGGGLGVAAVVLVLGWLALGWQRNRHRFLLMQAALEKGINRFPDAPPFWLVSLRQGVTILALGVALGSVGAGSWWLGHDVPMPAVTSTASTEPAAEEPPPPDPGPRDHRPHPPAPNPQADRWHRAQSEVILGLASIGIGIILSFVGVVRIVFARVEQVAAEQAAQSSL